MRVSAEPADPGFREDAGDFTVLLNGEPQSATQTGRAVITADEEAGMIWFHPCDSDGKLMMYGDFGCTCTEVIEGKVSIYRFRWDERK